MKASLPDVDLEEGGTTLRRLVGALSITEELIDFLRPPGGTISFLVIPSSWILQSTIFTRKEYVRNILKCLFFLICSLEIYQAMLWLSLLSCIAIFLPNCSNYGCNFFYKEEPTMLNFRLGLQVTYCSNQLETNTSNSGTA